MNQDKKELSPDAARNVEQWVQKIVDLGTEAEAADQHAEFCTALACTFAQSLTFVDDVEKVSRILAGTMVTYVEMCARDDQEGATLQ